MKDSTPPSMAQVASIPMSGLGDSVGANANANARRSSPVVSTAPSVVTDERKPTIFSDPAAPISSTPSVPVPVLPQQPPTSRAQYPQYQSQPQSQGQSQNQSQTYIQRDERLSARFNSLADYLAATTSIPGASGAFPMGLGVGMGVGVGVGGLGLGGNRGGLSSSNGHGMGGEC